MTYILGEMFGIDHSLGSEILGNLGGKFSHSINESKTRPLELDESTMRLSEQIKSLPDASKKTKGIH